MKYPVWYWILQLTVLAALIPAIRDGFDKNVPLSGTSRFIRVVGGSLWAGIIVLGMFVKLWEAIHKTGG
jgi:hypothetical protein